MSGELTDTELLDWVAKNYTVRYENVGDIRLIKRDKNDEGDVLTKRFRSALSKILRTEGLV